MRTTIDLPDDLHGAVTQIAKNAGMSMSETVAHMVRSFIPATGSPRTSISPVTGLMTFSNGIPITSEQVRAMIAEDEDDEIDW